jgi:transposase
MELKSVKNIDDSSDVDLHALYKSGEELTVSFIKFLLDRLKGIEAIVKKQSEEIQQLKAIISKDSHNSSKPPSSDGYRKKSIKSLRKKSKRKSGGQEGHPGTSLQIMNNPDTIKRLEVEICEQCRTNGHLEVIGIKRRQVVDVEIKKTVTELQADMAECCRCGHITIAAFPEEVTQAVQYGSSVKALISYMRNLNFMPSERLTEMFEDVFHIPLSEGTIYNTTRKCSKILEPFDDFVKEMLLRAPVVHFDESGIRIEKSLHWLQSASNELYTYYFPHKRRGKIAMDQMGVLPQFTGTAIHDSYASYFEYECLHGLCNSHHLRELIFLNEEMAQRWAKKMIELLLKIKEKAEKAKTNSRTIKKSLMVYYEQRFKRILYEGFKENPEVVVKKKSKGRKKKGKVLCLLERLKTRIHQVLAFMYDVLVPFDNNQAERDIRMAKLYQKISGCFRTMEGAVDFFRIRSFISTVRKHKICVLSALKKLYETGEFCGIMAE